MRTIGFHGKSTLLRAIAHGFYDKVPGDGRNLCVSARTTVSIRAEDGRYVHNTDISSFVSDLPTAANIDPLHFSTSNASGSTSQAASVMEALEMSASLLLLDEDTCSNNFMVRDSRMRSLVSHETITPYSYRINGIYNQLGVSSIVVTGGTGDWFDVLDVCLMMDNYHCLDVTMRAKSISKTFSNGRVQYNGRGLVHQLHWDHTLHPRRITVNSLESIRSVIGGLEVSRLEQLTHSSKASISGVVWCTEAILEELRTRRLSPVIDELLKHIDVVLDFSFSYRTAAYPAFRPRALDLLMTIFRLRGIKFE